MRSWYQKQSEAEGRWVDSNLNPPIRVVDYIRLHPHQLLILLVEHLAAMTDVFVLQFWGWVLHLLKKNSVCWPSLKLKTHISRSRYSVGRCRFWSGVSRWTYWRAVVVHDDCGVPDNWGTSWKVRNFIKVTKQGVNLRGVGFGSEAHDPIDDRLLAVDGRSTGLA